MDNGNNGNNSFDFTDDYEYCRIFLGSIVPWSLAVYISFAVIGATANIMLLLAIYTDPIKCFRTPTTYFIVNLAIADLLSSLYYIEELLVSETEYKSTVCFPGAWATIHTAISYFVYFLPFPSVTILALERYLSIARPLWHQVNFTSQLCRVAIIVIWTINCIFTVIIVILYDHVEIITVYPSVFYLSTVCIYLMAFISIRKQRLILATDNSKSESVKKMMKTRLTHKKRFLTTVLIINVVLIFVIPTIIGSHWQNVVGDETTTTAVVLFYIADVMFLINMVANPFLYVWRLPKYRKTIFLMYCCKK